MICDNCKHEPLEEKQCLDCGEDNGYSFFESKEWEKFGWKFWIEHTGKLHVVYTGDWELWIAEGFPNVKNSSARSVLFTDDEWELIEKSTRLSKGIKEFREVI